MKDVIFGPGVKKYRFCKVIVTFVMITVRLLKFIMTTQWQSSLLIFSSSKNMCRNDFVEV